MHAVVVPTKNILKNDISLSEVINYPDASFLSMKLTRYAIPQQHAFNLLTEEEKHSRDVPITHVKKKITIIMLTDKIRLPFEGLPYELYRLLRVDKTGRFLPIIHQDFLQTRAMDLEPVESSTYNTTIIIKYNPCSPGWLRFVLQVESALGQLLNLGFTTKDIDEIKRIFSETNVYLLCATMFIGSIHVSIYFELNIKNFYYSHY